MRNLFIFICSNDKCSEIIDYYNSYYENFIVVINNKNISNNNNIIRNEKLNGYFELDNNQNINLFVLNNLNNTDYDNYVFLYGNLLEYNNIINDLNMNKTKINIDNFDLNLDKSNFSYNILNKSNIHEIKKKYMIL